MEFDMRTNNSGSVVAVIFLHILSAACHRLFIIVVHDCTFVSFCLCNFFIFNFTLYIFKYMYDQFFTFSINCLYSVRPFLRFREFVLEYSNLEYSWRFSLFLSLSLSLSFSLRCACLHINWLSARLIDRALLFHESCLCHEYANWKFACAHFLAR